MIILENISKTYSTPSGQIHALRDINLQVAAGEICGVIGRSGAGKSTLIRCVNLLERPTTGRVSVDNQDLLALSNKQLRQARHRIGMVFQHFNLLASRTVFQNVAFQLAILGHSKAEIAREVEPFLELTGLTDKRDAYPSQLSGGQKQRVAIARALVTQPNVLLCDEMTSALDPETTHSILDLVKRINTELNLSILLITHEMNVIKTIADHVAVIDAGSIVENTDVVSLFRNPQSEVAQQFVKGDMHDHIPEELRILIHPDAQAGDKLLIQIAFIGKSATQPVIEEFVNRSKVRINIIQANLEYMRQETIGVMTVSLEGADGACRDAIQILKGLGVNVEVLGYVN
ncbi:MAG: methionine ABC transporter ATP-binding protein [Coxiella sp. (in: Bacteria)]|nr:MAG: methionine ABC transporter ATP-binding protein [Coxiella sp. (in: g-proteobacteria)]